MLTIAVFPNMGKENANMVLNRIFNFFRDKEVKVVMPMNEAKHFGYENDGVENIEELPIDMALSIGGDGTLLGIVRRLYERNIPVCGINIGTLGFLADIELQEIESKLKKILEGQYYIEERMMIAGFVKAPGQAERFLGHAINDVVVNKGGGARMLNLGLSVDHCGVMDYKADGIIVSTATGSTAYSLSAGGPIINPKIKVLVLTPICPHTFNARPMVIDENDEVCIEMRTPHTDTVATFDGQENFRIPSRAAVIVRKALLPAKIVKFDDKNYYQTIRTKLLYNA